MARGPSIELSLNITSSGREDVDRLVNSLGVAKKALEGLPQNLKLAEAFKKAQEAADALAGSSGGVSKWAQAFASVRAGASSVNDELQKMRPKWEQVVASTDAGTVAASRFAGKWQEILAAGRALAATKVDLGLLKEAQDADKLIAKGNSIVGTLSRINEIKVDLGLLKTSKEIDVILDKGGKLIQRFDTLGSTKVAVDFRKFESDISAIIAKAERVKETLRGLDNSKIDVSFLKGIKELDLLIAKGKQAVDTFRKIETTKVDLDVTKAVASVDRLKRAVGSIGGGGGGSGLSAVAKDADRAGNSISKVASEALFLRRVLVSLGFVAFGKEILDTVANFDRLRASFKAVFQEDAGKELDFIRVQAERLGLSVLALSDNYVKFQTSVKGTAAEGTIAQDVFLATAEAAATLSLSQESLTGSLNALTQIAAKGTASLEEVRQQLGDRLPGAARIAAEGLGITQQKLFALIVAGQIDSTTFLAGFGKGLRDNFGTDTTTRIETVSAALQRVKDSFLSLIDAATQGAGRTAIVDASNALAKFASDPANIKGLQDLVANVIGLGRTLVEVKGIILNLAAAYVTFRVAAASVDIFSGLGKLATGAGAASTAVKAFADSTTTFAKVAPVITGGATALVGLGAAAKIAQAALVPLLGAVAALVVPYLATSAAVEFFTARSDKAAAAAATSAKALKDFFTEAGKAGALKAVGINLDFISTSLVKSSVELKQASEGGLKDYISELESLGQQLKEQEELVEAEIAANKAKALSIQNNADATAAEKNEVFFLNSSLKDLVIIQARVKKQTDEVAGAFADAAVRLRRLTITADELDKISFEKLSAGSRDLVLAFDKLVSQGKAVSSALEKAIPESFGEGSVKGITDTIQAMQVLENQGKATGEEIREGLSKALAKLGSSDLAKFQANAKLAFGTAEIGVEGLAKALRAVGSAGLSKFGLDFELAGTKISKQFSELNLVFGDLAQNAQVSAVKINAAFSNLIDSAKTAEELRSLNQQVTALSITSTTSLGVFQDNLDRLADKTRVTSDLVGTALGDSLSRFSIAGSKQLTALAAQAVIDFNRIEKSGVASLEELQTAFAAVAAAALKATGGILPIELKLKAFDLDAFDVLVRSAETAGDRVREAFNSALSGADTLAQLAILEQALKNTYNNARISAEQYAIAADAAFGKGLELLAKKTEDSSTRIRQAFESAISGLSSATQVQAFSDALTKAFAAGKLSAEDFSKTSAALISQSFALIVSTVETSSTRIAASFSSALSSSSNLEQVAALKNAIQDAFAAGQVSAKDYAVALDQIATKTFELAQQVDNQLSGALGRLGVQTKEQLRIISEQYRKDFDQLLSAGVLTTEQLAIAFEKYAEAAIKAGNGVADSFLAGQASGLGLEGVLDKLIGKAETFKNVIQSIELPSPENFTTEALQAQLVEFSRILASGSGFVDPAVIRAVIAELVRRGVTPGRNFNLKSDESPSSQKSSGDSSAPKTTNIFNFNDATLSASRAKSVVVPTLKRLADRGAR